MNLGLELVNPSSVDESWTVVHCNPKDVKERPASKAENVTWADIARLKQACPGRTSRTETSLSTRSRLVHGAASITLDLEERIQVDSCRFANPSLFRS